MYFYMGKFVNYKIRFSITVIDANESVYMYKKINEYLM